MGQNNKELKMASGILVCLMPHKFIHPGGMPQCNGFVKAVL
jgi:hypothetical protein